jgi:hypothetical protein
MIRRVLLAGLLTLAAATLSGCPHQGQDFDPGTCQAYDLTDPGEPQQTPCPAPGRVVSRPTATPTI